MQLKFLNCLPVISLSKVDILIKFGLFVYTENWEYAYRPMSLK